MTNPSITEPSSRVNGSDVRRWNILGGIGIALTLLWLVVPDRISIDRSECFGECPVYSLQASSSGRLTYFGKAFVTHRGSLDADLSRAQFKEFAAALAPLRSWGVHHIACPGGMAEDSPGFSVTWWKGPIPLGLTGYNYGCDTPRKQEIEAAFDRAERAIRVDRLIGTEREREGLVAERAAYRLREFGTSPPTQQVE